MKNKVMYTAVVMGLIIFGLMWRTGGTLAQEETPAEEIPFVDRDGDGVNDMLQRGWGLRFNRNKGMRENVREQLNPVMVDTDDDGVADTPYIDTDGDGEVDTPLHDYLASEREERQAEMAEFRAKLKELVDTDEDGVPDTPYIDTDDDGVVDTPLKDYVDALREEGVFMGRGPMGGRMNELIDTDEDGVPDTPMHQYLMEQFGTFDSDGDGVPDAATPEEIRQHLQEMQQWRQQIQQRLEQGLEPFLDEDGDGIPDDLPSHMRWRGGNKSNAGNGNK